jgi:hypothetical protein
MDHVGGLGNLFWTIRKLDNMHHALRHRRIDLWIPEIDVWEHLLGVLRHTEGNFMSDFVIEAQEYGDGVLLEEEGLRVTALHNTHLPRRADGAWRSSGLRSRRRERKSSSRATPEASGNSCHCWRLRPAPDGDRHHPPLRWSAAQEVDRLPDAGIYPPRPAILNDREGQFGRCARCWETGWTSWRMHNTYV